MVEVLPDLEDEELKTELEQRLFRRYRNDKIYNKITKGNSKAKELWNKVIKVDIKIVEIKEQEEHRQVLFEG